MLSSWHLEPDLIRSVYSDHIMPLVCLKVPQCLQEPGWECIQSEVSHITLAGIRVPQHGQMWL